LIAKKSKDAHDPDQAESSGTYSGAETTANTVDGNTQMAKGVQVLNQLTTRRRYL